jgi:hypothetical protein
VVVVLSDLLRAVRLRGAVFYYVDGSAPWVAAAPAAPEIIPAIMPGVDHLMEFHGIATGSCWAAIEGESPIRLHEGDALTAGILEHENPRVQPLPVAAAAPALGPVAGHPEAGWRRDVHAGDAGLEAAARLGLRRGERTQRERPRAGSRRQGEQRAEAAQREPVLAWFRHQQQGGPEGARSPGRAADPPSPTARSPAA